MPSFRPKNPFGFPFATIGQFDLENYDFLLGISANVLDQHRLPPSLISQHTANDVISV